MSRIHEALKKAAEERSSKLATDPAIHLDVAGELTASSIAEKVLERPAPRSDVRKPADPGRSAFEELVKKCAHPRWVADPRTSVFHGADRNQIGAERFRTLRSRLYQIASTQPLKKILITSSIPSEGKTFVAYNLASSIVRQNERRVLLIDGDLRASRLHRGLGAPLTPGLTDYLRGECDEFEVIQKGFDNNLCFIPGGNPVSNPSELLMGERMKRLLDMAAPIFDWIVVDSPPALPVHDASMLADLCDGVLFVVRAGQTDYQMAEKASSEFVNKNLLGVVLNCVEKGDAYGGYYYGYPLKEVAERI
ncbi:MAG: CpsD/CapB family tyrosine-protein kinase [Candidatus Acidiferrum sp.]